MRALLGVMVLVNVLVIAGCGGSGTLLADSAPADEAAPPTDAAQSVDAGVDGPPPSCVPAATSAEHRALFALAEGNLGVVDLDTRAATCRVAAGGAVSTDAVLRAGHGTIYVVNRWGSDNVVLLDPAEFTVLKQFSTGAGSNPQDVAPLTASRLYIPLSTSGEVLVADPTQADGEEEIHRIDLSTIAASPSPTSTVALGGEVFVALAFLDPETYTPTRAGAIAVIDPTSDTVTEVIDLPARNPFARMQAVPGARTLVLNLAEDFESQSGCFAVVDTAARTASCVVENPACGGWGMALAASAAGHVWASVEAAKFTANAALCHFTLDGTVVQAGAATEDRSLTDLGLDDRCEIFAADSKTPGRVRIVGALSDAEIAGQSDCGQPAMMAGVLFLP
jgi:hypothetical protein